MLANLFLHYAFDKWMERECPDIPFERYADDGVGDMPMVMSSLSVMRMIA